MRYHFNGPSTSIHKAQSNGNPAPHATRHISRAFLLYRSPCCVYRYYVYGRFARQIALDCADVNGYRAGPRYSPYRVKPTHVLVEHFTAPCAPSSALGVASNPL